MLLVDVAIEPTSTHCDSCLCFFRSVWKPWNHSLPSPNASVPNPSPSSWPTERPSSSPCRSVCLSVWFLTYTGLAYYLYLNLESSHMWCIFCFDVCVHQEAAVRCKKQFSASLEDRDDLLKQMLNWAFGGFQPSGPNALKPSNNKNGENIRLWAWIDSVSTVWLSW